MPFLDETGLMRLKSLLDSRYSSIDHDHLDIKQQIYQSTYGPNSLEYMEFKTPGSTTITLPPGAKTMSVTACGAGGGGGFVSRSSSSDFNSGGGGGGGGAAILNVIYNIEGLDKITITIGSGGLGGYEYEEPDGNGYYDTIYVDGSKGGSTVIGNFVTLSGGSGGKRAINASSHSSSGGAAGGSGGGAGGKASYSSSYKYTNGSSGISGSGGTGSNIGGGGGGGSIGKGGNAYYYSERSSGSPSGSYLPGYGGGGGGASSKVGLNGSSIRAGRGGNGYAKLVWGY